MIPNYYSSSEIASRFGWSRQQVSATARREGWGFECIGNAYLYNALDVDLYAQARIRTNLARQLGWKPNIRGRPLIRHDDFDIECPVCGCFGVEYSPNAEIQETGNVPWLCENEHSGDRKLSAPPMAS